MQRQEKWMHMTIPLCMVKNMKKEHGHFLSKQASASVKALFCISIVFVGLFLASCSHEENDYALISNTFADFLDGSYSYSFDTLELYTDDTGYEYYYFEMNLHDSYANDRVSGIICAKPGIDYIYVHSSVFNGIHSDIVKKYNELKNSGKGHVLTDKEIEIVTNNIFEITQIPLMTE